MKEEERILVRYRDHDFYDDTDLYYNGLCNSTEFLDHKLDNLYKLAVYDMLYSRWVEDKEPEKEAFKKQPFPDIIPKKKRSPKNRTTPKTLKAILVFAHKEAPEISPKNPTKDRQKIELEKEAFKKLPFPDHIPVFAHEEAPGKGFRSSFKLAGNTIFSRKTTDDILVRISQEPPIKKRPRNEDESDSNRTKKRRNDEDIVSKLKTRLQKDDAILVIKKNLTATDVKDSNSRLAIPESQIIDHNFLSGEEVKWLSDRDGKAVRHLHVRLIDPSGEECDIKLARWTMGNNVVYNLLSPWKLVVARNKLRENTPVELYSFRDGPKLYFALVKIQP